MSHEQTHGTAGDLRVERTRRSLRAALLALADEHGYQKVTVGDIAERAVVNRATFYRHYEDKEDLAADITVQAALETGRLSPVVAGQRVDVATRIESGTALFEHFAHHRRLYLPLLAYPRNRRFMIRARDLLSALVRERIDTVERSSAKGPIPQDMVAIFAVEQFLGLVSWWLERGAAYSPRQIATWFVQYQFYGYFRMLGISDLLPDEPSGSSAD